MSDEETVLVEEVSEEETSSPVESEVEDSEQVETEQEETPGPDEEEEEAEEIEFNFGGNKMVLPKGQLPEELASKVQEFADGTWSDYTKKSQDVAEQRKALEARTGVVEKLESLQGDALDKYSEGLRLRAELEQYSKVDWDSLWQSDPDQARKHSDLASQKKAQLNSTVQEVAKFEAELESTRKAETARLMEEGKKLVTKRIPDFETRADEVVDYAVKTYGISKEDAETWPLNPMAAEAMYKAMQYDRLQAKATQKAKPKPVQAKPVKPMKAKGNAKNKPDLVKDADKMSYKQWTDQYQQEHGR